ncbi:MAG: HAD-IB family phosphatase [Candidatus Roizmanbacteria bacterium]
MKYDHIIFDFDSTLVGVESIETLAEIALCGAPEKGKILNAIKQITSDAMAGKIPFDMALKQRISQMRLKQSMIVQTGQKMLSHISPSVRDTYAFFRNNSGRIMVVSGGFEEIIWPVTDVLGIPRHRVFSNRFLYDGDTIVGIDPTRFMSKQKGKVHLLQNLQLKGRIAVIGDGMTDMQMKEYDPKRVDTFAYTEHIARDEVVRGADYVITSMHDLVNHLRPSVLLCEHIDSLAQQLFEAEGYQVTTLDHAPTEIELIQMAQRLDIIGIRSRTQITQSVLDAAPHLSHVLAYCVGTDQIDIPACDKKGVQVVHVKYASSRSVAEIVIGSIISLSRRMPMAVDHATKGKWNKSAEQRHEVRGKTLGIVGYGTIGTEVGVIAEAIGMKVIAHDLCERPTQGHVVLSKTLEEVLHESDYITLHVDGRPSNANLIGKNQIAQMKQGGYILNYSRGSVVDIHAVDEGLRSGKLAGAAIDVYPMEPARNGEFHFPFAEYDNVILTPHIGGSTTEAQARIADEVTSRCIRSLKPVHA